jgi:hydroxylaminobenzene mutase
MTILKDRPAFGSGPKQPPEEKQMGEPTLYVVSTERRLLQLGVTLFLLGLLTGFSLPLLENPRMGLASHLEGVLNGLLLILLGLVWSRLTLTRTQARLSFAFLVYGTFANWVATLLAALWGAGRAMPIAAAGHEGLAWQEGLLNLLLYSLSAAMVAAVALVLWGLRGHSPDFRQVRGTQ